MTLLIGWVGVDARGPTSLYLASDSRISWGKQLVWDRGKKLFNATKKPHILGFYGDVVFPSQLLSQIVQQIDNDLLFPQDATPVECVERIVSSITASLKDSPKALSCDFGILHGMRQGELMESQFHLSKVEFAKGVPSIEKLETRRSESTLFDPLGSGAAEMRSCYDRWTRPKEGGGLAGTSRAVFSALADAVRECEDRHTGGPPQLVGLHRIGPAQTFGVVWQQKRWVLGSEILDDRVNLRATKWHNDLFELVDPVTLVRDKVAQPQPRPRILERKRN